MSADRVARLLDARSTRRVAQLAAGAGIVLAAAPLALAETETGWYLCEQKCRGLVKGRGMKPAGVCPAGGKHQALKTLQYVLLAESTLNGDNLSFRWHRCVACAALFHDSGFAQHGVCPKNGEHTPGNSLTYTLWLGVPVAGMMDDAWDECAKCRGLFNYAGGNTGVCPAGGGHSRLGTNISLFFLN